MWCGVTSVVCGVTSVVCGVQLKSTRGKVTSQERKQEEQSRERDYLQQELSVNEQTREHSDKIIASLQTHLEQQTLNAQQLAKQVGASVNGAPHFR